MDCFSLCDMVSVSKKMQAVFSTARKLSKSDIPVLIQGETGTGKELLSKAIHELSGRTGELVVLDCGSIPETMAESILFGHEKGAFTDAFQSHKGLLEQANRGTLFLDEIASLPPRIQPKLLRCLEEKRVKRVGGTSQIDIDVRFLAASNVQLERMVVEEKFREDLFYRVAVGRIVLPPLRDREGDPTFLAKIFSEKFEKKISESTSKVLEGLEWGGNVRELKNVVESSCILMEDGKKTVTPGDLRILNLNKNSVKESFETLLKIGIEDMLAKGFKYREIKDSLTGCLEEKVVSFMLSKHEGNVSKSAEASGIDRKYFRILVKRKMEKDGTT